MMRDRIQSGLERSFRKHRIVFWHDPETRFREEFDAISIEGVTKTEVVNNEFMLKHRLIREEPRQPFLVYRPGPLPEDARNWLLDLEMGHGVFLADRGALLLMELGLPPRFGDLIEGHARFFEAKARVDRLKAVIEETDNAADIRLKMVAVCAGTPPKLDEVLETLLSELGRDEEKLIGLIARSGLAPASRRGSSRAPMRWSWTSRPGSRRRRSCSWRAGATTPGIGTHSSSCPPAMRRRCRSAGTCPAAHLTGWPG
jgi:hypothetical protein